MTELFDQTVIDNEPSTQLAVAERDHDLSPLAIIRQAVESGLGPDQLKALVDLQEQVRASRAKEEFAAAMNACQEELPLIVKDGENKQTGQRYAKMDNIHIRAKPTILKHGFALSFSEADCPTPSFKRTVCKVRHRAGHSEDHFLDLPLDGFSAKGTPIGSMNPVQAAASTGTYAQRYLTCRIFNITIADTDADGRAPAYENPEANPKAPKAAPRGQRSDKPAPPQVNPHGVSRADVMEITDEWVKHNPQGVSEDWIDWLRKTAGRVNIDDKWQHWTKADLGKLQSQLGLARTDDIPY